MMDPVVHFEMPYDDRERMARFYERPSAGSCRCSVRRWATTLSRRPREAGREGDGRRGAINGGFFPRVPTGPASIPRW